MLRAANYLVAAVLGIWGEQGFSLGLGDIQIISHLNQRFFAIIPLTEVGPEDLENLRVRLAKSDDFARAGVEIDDSNAGLSFLVREEGEPHVIVASAQPVREPMLNFVVEARWAGGNIVRSYTALLDPPENTPAVQVAEAAPRRSRAPEPAATPEPTPSSAPVASPSAAAADSGEAPRGSAWYGPVQPQETTWSVATKLRPNTRVTMDQMLLAIYRANPTAFKGGLNGLQKGSRLREPSMDEILATDAVTAHAEVDRLKRGLDSAPKPTAEPQPEPRPVPRLAPPKPEPRLEAKPEPRPEPKPEPKPELRPEPKPEPKVEPKAEPKPAPPDAVKPEAPAEPPPATMPEPAPAPEPEPAAPAPAEAPVADAAVPVPASQPAEMAAAVPSEAPAPPPAAEAAGVPLQAILAGVLVFASVLLGALLFMRRRQQAEDARAAAAAKAEEGSEDSTSILEGSPLAAGAVAASTASPPVDEPMEPVAEPVFELEAAPEPPPAAVEVPMEPEPMEAVPVEADYESAAQPPSADASLGNLDAGDPIAEADFHLAYGLYDEAVQLLRHHILTSPDRLDLQLKLAETYFAAGRPTEFLACAEELHGKLEPADWHKLTIMGRQLCPDAELFQAPLADPAALDAQSLDMTLDDEPAVVLSAAPAEPVAAPAPPVPVLESPFETVQPVAIPPIAAPVFDLSSFDLDNEQAPSDPRPPPAPAIPAAPPIGSGRTIEFDLNELDLGDGLESNADLPEAAFGDEAGTKLDLARAYVDMGDNEAARSLLNEVLEGGTDEQKQEAEGLLRRLPG